jgi:uncharacterized DUF497 family protein
MGFSARLGRIFAKHKVSFDEAATAFDDCFSVTKADPDHSIAENRFLTLGLSCRHRLVLVAHTDDPGEISIISARLPTRSERMPTKTNESMKLKDTMRRQYDMTGGVRVKYAGRRKGDVVMVPIAPDVAAAFPDAEAVNEALRVLLKAAKNVAPAA